MTNLDKEIKKSIYKNWACNRWLGIKDIPTIFKVLRDNSKKKKQLKQSGKLISPKHLSEIYVGHDKQIDSWVEPMAAHTQSCPYWDSTRLFYGKEMNFGFDEKPFEYFLGIRQTFLAPFIPIPICSYEVVYILGESDEPFRDCMKKYFKARSFYDHAKEFGAKQIFEKTNVYFVDSDVTYKNDPVWSTCG